MPPRKSALQLLLLPVVLVGAGACCYASVRLVCAVAGLLRPASIPFLSRTELTKTLIVIPLLVASFPLGLLLANLTVWLLPPVRRFFVREAAGRPRGDFATANRDVLKLAATVFVPLFLIALCAAMFGA